MKTYQILAVILLYFTTAVIHNPSAFAQETSTQPEPETLTVPDTIAEHETKAPDTIMVKEPKLHTYNWGILWSGSWEQKTSPAEDEPKLSGTLNNRGEMSLHYIPFDLLWRGQILDRRPFNLDFNSPWGDPEKVFTHYTMGLYHKATGSRLLHGPINEEGLPARIRTPWIRSPPYAENHANTIADLRTTISSSRDDEIYLYLASPLLELTPSFLLKGFFSAQTETEKQTPAFSGGFDFRFPKNTRLMTEMFYTGRTLPPKELVPWFSDPPSLPQRDFRLYAAGLLFSNAWFSISSDFAQSEAFSWGSDIYANLGVSFSPPITINSRKHPLLFSLAADGAGSRYINRDGTHYKEGFRGAAKFEWRNRYNSLFKIDSVLRADAFGQNFNRSSTDIYYRFPSKRDSNLVRVSTISLSADRNGENHLKIHDSYSGNLGLNVSMEQIKQKTPLKVNLGASIKGLSKSDIDVKPFPVPNSSWDLESTAFNWELIWTYGVFQIRTKTGCIIYAEKDEKWDFSAALSARFKQGRLSIKAATPDFPKKWHWSAAWKLEVHGKS